MQISCAFLQDICLLCFFFCETVFIVKWERFLSQIVTISIHRSTQTYRRRTRGKSLTTASYSISHFMSRPHIITANLSRHRLVMRAFKAQSKWIYAFDPISLSLYHVAAGLLGSLSVGSNLRPPDRSMTSQTLFFCLVNPTAPSEEIQLNLSFKEYVTAGA